MNTKWKNNLVKLFQYNHNNHLSRKWMKDERKSRRINERPGASTCSFCVFFFAAVPNIGIEMDDDDDGWWHVTQLTTDTERREPHRSKEMFELILIRNARDYRRVCCRRIQVANLWKKKKSFSVRRKNTDTECSMGETEWNEIRLSEMSRFLWRRPLVQSYARLTLRSELRDRMSWPKMEMCF